MKVEKITTDCADLVLELHGEFDALGSAQIRPDLEAVAVQSASGVVFLDLKNVSFIDSSGVGAIVFLYKRLKEHGRMLKIVGAHGQPRELLELLRIHKAIPVEIATPEESGPGETSCVA